jgi:hypothetical protein
VNEADLVVAAGEMVVLKIDIALLERDIARLKRERDKLESGSEEALELSRIIAEQMAVLEEAKEKVDLIRWAMTRVAIRVAMRMAWTRFKRGAKGIWGRARGRGRGRGPGRPGGPMLPARWQPPRRPRRPRHRPPPSIPRAHVADDLEKMKVFLSGGSYPTPDITLGR